MYLGDPREQQICLDEHTVWEEDNRVEKRWQWGARILDLCDLSPEEYATTIFHTEEAVTPGGKVKDAIVASFSKSSVKFAYPYAPASDLYIVIKDSDGNSETVMIPAGDPTPYSVELTTIDTSKVSNLLIGLSESDAKTSKCEDEKYIYSITKSVTPTDFVKYAYMKHTLVEDGLTEEEVVGAGLHDATVNDKDAIYDYVIKPVIIPGFNDMPEEEYEEILAREQLDLLIFSTTNVQNIYLNKTDYQTDSWVLNYATLSLGGTNYYVTRFVQENLVNICDTNYETPEDIVFSYKVIIK